MKRAFLLIFLCGIWFSSKSFYRIDGQVNMRFAIRPVKSLKK